MNPEDQNYGAGAEAAHQADSIQKQMTAEAIADAPEQAPVDNSILAGIEQDEDMKSLSDIIHEGGPKLDPNPTDLSADATKETEPKEKKPFNFKPILIAIIAVVVLGAAGFGIFALISGGSEGGGGAKADPERLAFFVEGDDENASYAIYNDKGEKLTDAVYDKVSDFNASGYAVAKKVNDEKLGIIANTGKLSVAYDKYSDISALGNYFVAASEEGNILIDGTGEKIMNVDTTESKYGLSSVYDGSSTVIYDAKGEKVGESKLKKPLSEVYVVEKSFCVHAGTTTRCYDTETGEKITEFESENELTFTSFAGGSSTDHKCMMFKETDENSNKRYLYFYGSLSPYDPIENRGMVSYDFLGSGACFFTDGEEYAMAGDAVKINFKELGASPSHLVLHDSTHYAYYAQKGDQYEIVIRQGDKNLVLDAGKYMPTITGNNKFFAIQYSKTTEKGRENYFAVFEDDIKPTYELTYEKSGIVDAVSTEGIDANGNITAGRSLINTEKGVIYTYKEYSGYVMHKGDIYVVSKSKKDSGEYITVVNKDGKELIAPGSFDFIKISGKFLIGKRGNDVVLLDMEGKELLKNYYDDLKVYDSHIEAVKDNKTEYYTLDIKQVK